mgnify:CR=1 FL=1
MVVCLVATLSVTAANLRLTYVTDSNGARQVLLTDADASPAQVMHLSGIRSEEGDEVYYTAFSGNLASLNIERAFCPPFPPRPPRRWAGVPCKAGVRHRSRCTGARRYHP